MGVPHLSNEVYIINEQLIINPVAITYMDPTPENMSKFTLPSTNTTYGAVLYEFFESNLRAALPASERVQFAKKKLEESVQLASSLKQQHIDTQSAQILQQYDGFGLPKTVLFSDRELTQAQKSSIVTQYVHHAFGERLSQPARKVYAISHIMTPEEKTRLKELIPEYQATYAALPRTHPDMARLAHEKLQLFSAGLEAIRKDEIDVRL